MPDVTVAQWATSGGRLKERLNADECHAIILRRHWIAEARELLAIMGFVGEPSESLLESVGQELWALSVEECNAAERHP